MKFAASSFFFIALAALELPGLSGPAQDPKPAKDSLDVVASAELQKACGLQKLAKNERESLAQVLSAHRADRRILSEAEGILEGMGLELVKCAVVQAHDGTSWFVVDSRFGTQFATKDIPFSFPAFTFRGGLYWCERKAFGGIRKIHVGGVEHRFFLADWKDL